MTLNSTQVKPHRTLSNTLMKVTQMRVTFKKTENIPFQSENESVSFKSRFFLLLHSFPPSALLKALKSGLRNLVH